MEQQPGGLDSEKIEKSVKSVKGVRHVNDFHLWSLSGGKNIVTVQVYMDIVDDIDHRKETHRIYHEIEDKMKEENIDHHTI